MGEGKGKRRSGLAASTELASLGIVDCLPEEENAEATMGRAKRSLDLLLHHGSRFIGGPNEPVHPFFLRLARPLRVRMLLQADATNQDILGKLEGLSASMRNFQFAFYDRPPIFRFIVIDEGAVCLLSHYCDKNIDRDRGSNLVSSGPQLEVHAGPDHTLTQAATRLFEDMWSRGTASMWD